MMTSEIKSAENAENIEIKSIEFELKSIDLEISKLNSRKKKLLDRKQKLKELIQKRECEYISSKNWSLKTFPWSEKVDCVLKEVFNMCEFRPFQLEVINATLSKEDVIIIMPTGGGKSLCYQLPALIENGITLVISPLVSLMEDQILSLKKINYPAIMLSANSTKEEVKLVAKTLQDISPQYKLIYVTPEKLVKSKRFMSHLKKCYEQGRFSRIAIDEVHCCSTWGHDFRPDYNYLGIFKDIFPGVPLLGLTATSTSKVTADIQNMLNIQRCLILKATFNRPNLYYEVITKPSSQKEILDLLENWLKYKFKGKTGIIYTTVIKECEDLTKELRKREIKAGVYHAMLDAKVRSKMHMKWVSGEYQVIVATLAFGMGIDKPDVRFVIHHSLSKSMENFYQESGRAGRDGKLSHSIVMYRLADVFKLSTMVFTQQKGLENLYNMVKYCIDSQTCRRSLIAEHFDEVWESTLCNNMCDHCKNAPQTRKIDIATHCRSLFEIIDQALKQEVKLTALKLIDAWYGKGSPNLRLPHIKCNLNRNVAEVMVSFLLCNGYLKEDFHFTAYSTISYIKKGAKYGLLEDSKYQVILNYCETLQKKFFLDKIDCPEFQHHNTKNEPNSFHEKFSKQKEREKKISKRKNEFSSTDEKFAHKRQKDCL